MHTQHNFCTQQLRYVGITRIVILFGLNLCAESRENSFQEVLKAVLFVGWSIPPTAHNRILSKVQKSFLSCTHVNSCQNHILYINLHILLNILS